MPEKVVLGCIGLGVMGEPIAANLVRRSGCRVVGFDPAAEPLARLAAEGWSRQGRSRMSGGSPGSSFCRCRAGRSWRTWPGACFE